MDTPRTFSNSDSKTIETPRSGMSIENFTFLANLGSGAFGQVELRVHPFTKKQVVVKRIDLAKSEKYLDSEIKAGKTIKHKNVVKFYEYFENEDEAQGYLIFEFVDGTTLFDFLEKRQFIPLKEDQTKALFKQAIEALLSCHNKGVAHLDLKLENMMISPRGKLTVIDFGLCKFTDNSPTCKAWVGSQDYAAPEIILRCPYDAFKADVYSLGVIMYIMLTGELPFSREARYSALEKGTYPQIIWPESCTASFQARDLCAKMLKPNPSDRASVSEVSEHNWLRVGSASTGKTFSVLSKVAKVKRMFLRNV